MELSAFAKTNTAARLRAAASRGALSHALILSGAGDRNAAAHYAAAALECTGTDKPCLVCAHCRKVLADIHLNEKDQNVLLKTVEEGPPYAAFLFCAENASVLLPTIRSRCVEVKLPPAGTVGEDDERTRELLRLIAEGRAAARAAFLLKLETAKATREELAALFEGARVILADALCTLCGAPPAEPRDEQALRAVLGSRLTKAQILGTIELLETYRNHCEYNVGVGPLLGGLAVELEEIL